MKYLREDEEGDEMAEEEIDDEEEPQFVNIAAGSVPFNVPEDDQALR